MGYGLEPPTVEEDRQELILAADEAAYVTGSAIAIDGGQAG